MLQSTSEHFDAEVSLETHLEALAAAMYAGRLGDIPGRRGRPRPRGAVSKAYPPVLGRWAPCCGA